MTARTIIFKHMGSCLRDLEISFDIDHEKKTIDVTLEFFDSALFTSFIERLDREQGIVAYVDDNESWNPTRPLWRIQLMLAGVPYRVEVARLVDVTDTNRRDFAVALVPDKPKLPAQPT